MTVYTWELEWYDGEERTSCLMFTDYNSESFVINLFMEDEVDNTVEDLSVELVKECEYSELDEIYQPDVIRYPE